MEDQQQCGRCKKTLSMDAFSPSYRGKRGTWCRACFAAYNRGERGASAQHQPLICQQCGQSYTPKQLRKAMFCSRECKESARTAAQAAANLARKPTNRTCMHCGELLPQSKQINAIFCNEKCNYGAHALQRKLRARTGEEGKPGYLRAFICDRDHWRCGICGKAVNKTRRYPDPLCASLDHVTPVSQGGTNDLWNLRLTHLRCNLVRGNRGGDEQLAML
jgi:hypothetical protein